MLHVAGTACAYELTVFVSECVLVRAACAHGCALCVRMHADSYFSLSRLHVCMPFNMRASCQNYVCLMPKNTNVKLFLHGLAYTF